MKSMVVQEEFGVSLLALSILGLKIAGRELAIGGVVIVIIVGAIAWLLYTRRTK